MVHRDLGVDPKGWIVIEEDSLLYEGLRICHAEWLGGLSRGSRVCEAVLQPSPNKSLHLTRAAILVFGALRCCRRPWQVSLVVERNLTVDPSVACSLLARGALFPCPPLAAGWAGGYCLTPMGACSPWGGQGSRGPVCWPQPVRDDPHPTGPRPRP